jgi:hypothetical protein
VFELFGTPIEGRVEVWTLNAADTARETPELAEPIVPQFVIDEMRELGAAARLAHSQHAIGAQLADMPCQHLRMRTRPTIEKSRLPATLRTLAGLHFLYRLNRLTTAVFACLYPFLYRRAKLYRTGALSLIVSRLGHPQSSPKVSATCSLEGLLNSPSDAF